MALYVCSNCGFKTTEENEMTEHGTYHESLKRVSVRLVKSIPGLIFSAGDITDFSDDYADTLISLGYAVKAY